MSFATSRAVSRPAGRDRITIAGVDVTTFRGKPTPTPRFTLTEPFAYGATSLQFPQVHAGYEADQFGTGDLSWVREGARVVISRTFDSDPEVVDYVGVVIAIEPAGRVLNLDIGGELSGRASLLDEQTQLFRYSNDVGHWAYLGAARLGLAFAPWSGPVAGIEVTHAGGQTMLSWLQYVGAMSQTTAGLQRALMPAAWGLATWGFDVKDYDTIHGTIYNDDARAVLQVVQDASEAPNVIYGTGITPDGERITNAKWPGVFAGPAPDYPIAGGAPFGIGTTNADTIDGSGIETLYTKLIQMGYLPFSFHPTDTYNPALADGVEALQADARMTENGIMSVTAWNRLFDNDVTGYSINGAHIAPLASDTRVEKYLYTSNGSIAGRNPDYDPTVLRVERTIDFGAGITKGAMIAYARGIIARSASLKNWVGTLRLNGNGAFVGMKDGDDAATLTAADMVPYRDIRPGENYWLPLFDGGTRFHVAGVDVDADGVTLTIDTQARDLVELREILDRDAESRRDVRREWNAQNRTRKPSSAMVARDESFGWNDRKVALEGGKWNRVPVIIGQHGQVNRVDIRLVNDEAEFAVGIVCRDITAHQFRLKVGNDPLAVSDESWLEKDSTQAMFDDRKLLYGMGTGKQPNGYGHRRKFDDAGTRTSASLTGRLLDDSPWSYICIAHTAVIAYLMIWPDRDCVLKKGRILYPQLDDAA